MLKYIWLCLLIQITVTSVSAQNIFLDENYNDWQTGVSSFTDPSGDGNSTGLDITDVKIGNDDHYLFMYLDIHSEINIQSSNNLTLYIDIDNNASTGLIKYGIGADLVYYFGERYGRYFKQGSYTYVHHNDIGLMTSPTVTSDKFEMGILRNFTAGFNAVSMSNNIKIVFTDESIAGDRAPNADGGISYTLNNSIKFTPAPFSLKKQKPEYLRIISYNVLKDNIFKSFTQSSFNRIFNALEPDIIGFCEIYDSTPEQTAGLIASYIPAGQGQKWYSAGVSPDIRVVSRYPILDSRSINGNGAFLIDVGPYKIVYIMAHLPCCDNDLGRQQEADHIMSFVRSVRFGISPFNAPQNTPIIISGDMNLVGLNEPLNTMITGDIDYNESYGPDFYPDWDDSSLDDLRPITTNIPGTFTWYSPDGTYSAGRLDYMIFTGSVIEAKNSFALWSDALTPAQLAEAGLQKDDSGIASDHIPVVCDFLPKGYSALADNDTPDDFIKIKVLRDRLIINADEFKDMDLNITISDIMGRVWYQEKALIFDNEKSINLENIPYNNLYILSIRHHNNLYSYKFFRF